MSKKQNKIVDQQCFDEKYTISEHDIDLSNLFKFQNSVLRVFGFYHHPNDSIIRKSYCVFIIILLLFNMLWHFTTFDFFYNREEKFSTKLLMKIGGILFPLNCFLNSVYLFIIQERRSNIIDFEINFEKLFNKYHNIEKRQHEIQKMKFFSNIIFFVGMLIAFMFICVYFFSLFSSSATRDFYGDFNDTLQYLEFDSETNIPFRLFCGILSVFATLSFVCTTSYYINYCGIMCKLLNYFNKTLEMFLVNNMLDFNDGLIFTKEIGFEELRKWHLKLCDLIQILNNCFKGFIFIVLSLHIPILIINLYIISNSNCIKYIDKVVIPAWMLISIFIIVIVIYIACRINTKVCLFYRTKLSFVVTLYLKAHESLQEIYYLQGDYYSQFGLHKVLKINFFLILMFKNFSYIDSNDDK